MKKAQRYSVNLFPHEVRKFKEMNRLYETWEGSASIISMSSTTATSLARVSKQLRQAEFSSMTGGIDEKRG